MPNKSIKKSFSSAKFFFPILILSTSTFAFGDIDHPRYAPPVVHCSVGAHGLITCNINSPYLRTDGPVLEAGDYTYMYAASYGESGNSRWMPYYVYQNSEHSQFVLYSPYVTVTADTVAPNNAWQCSTQNCTCSASVAYCPFNNTPYNK